MSNCHVIHKNALFDKKELDRPFFSFLIFLLFLSLFNSSNIAIIKSIGDFALYALIVYLCYKIISNPKSYKFNYLFFIFFVYIIICLIRSIITLSGFNLVFQICTVLLIAIYCSNCSKNFIVNNLFYALLFSIPFCIIDVILYRINGEARIYGNSNMIGMISFAFTVTCFIRHWRSNKNRKVAIFLGIVLILFSSTRTALLTILTGVIFYYVLRNKNKKFVKTFFILFIIAIIIGIYLYVFANELPFMQKLNEIIFNLTNKNLFSGRNRIWKKIFLNYNTNTLFWGYGLDYEISSLTGENVSAHNQFIQILVQQGLVGLVFFLSVLYYIYFKAYRKEEAICSCFVLMIIVYNTFEVCLIQTHFCIGMIFWFLMFASINSTKKNLRVYKHHCFEQ